MVSKNDVLDLNIVKKNTVETCRKNSLWKVVFIALNKLLENTSHAVMLSKLCKTT